MSAVVTLPPLLPMVIRLPMLVACFAALAHEAVQLEAQQITASREVERGGKTPASYSF